MEIIKKYGLIFASAVLLASAVFISVNKGGDFTARAEATNYTSEWTATKLFVSDVNYVNSANNQTNRRDVPFGIASWSVKGFGDNQSQLFEETWESPAMPNIKYRLASQNCPGFDNSLSGLVNDRGFKYSGTFDKNDWIMGIVGGRVGNSSLCGEIRKVDLQDNGTWQYASQPNRIGNDAKNNAAGDAVFCFDHSDINCWTSAGSYSLIYSDKMNIDASGVRAVLTMMPLKWTVTGKIY